MLKNNITDVDLHKYIKIKINLDDDLPLEKTLNMYNVVYLLILFLIDFATIITTMCFQKNVHVNNIQMLYHNKIDVSGGIDVNKTSACKGCIFCGIFQIKDLRFKQLSVTVVMY